MFCYVDFDFVFIAQTSCDVCSVVKRAQVNCERIRELCLWAFFYLLLFDERPWGKSVLNLISFDVTKKTLLIAKLLTDKSLVTGFSLHIIILSWILLFWQCLNFCVIIGIKGVRCLPVTRKQCLLGSCFIAFTVDRTNRMYDMLCRQIIALCHTYFASFAVCNRRQN